jgi:gluconolactonase
MKTLIYAMAFFLLQSTYSGCARKGDDNSSADDNEVRTAPYVEKLHPDLGSVMPDQAAVEVLADGFEWSEGPLWVPSHNFLLFTDIPNNSVLRWREGAGTDLYLRPSGYTGHEPRAGEGGANGLVLGSDGRLILCQHGDRRIAVMEAPLDAPESEFTTLTASWKGKRYNSPNDAVLHSNGTLYFTDPPYGLEDGVTDPKKELNFQGVFMLASDGAVHLLTDEFTRPNGIALSPDENTMYIANSDPKHAVVMAFDVGEDGKIGNGRLFADMNAEARSEKGLPDGMVVHSKGYVFATGPGGVWIFTEEGDLLGKVRTGVATANCTLGNDEGYLYITADMYLMRVALVRNV